MTVEARPNGRGGSGTSGSRGAAESLTPFVGRREELAQVTRLVGQSRMLTMAGPGGSGKTRLALRIAVILASDYPGGVHVVELARVEDPRHVPDAILTGVGAIGEPGRDPAETAAASIEGAALIVLDNCEHVAEAAAAAADAMLRANDDLRILATSRESPLGVEGETTFLLPGLAVPPEGSDGRIEDADSVKLFLERARRNRTGFAIDTPATAEAVARICRELEGMPLAIELAAARLRMMTAEQIAEGLSDQARLLSGGARTSRPQHRSLLASIEWSHSLLEPGEQALLRRLSVFVGGFTLDAAEHVCGEGLDVLGLLGHLVDKSLLAYEPDAGAARYRMLESVRQFAARQLRESGEEATVRSRHLDWLLELVRDADVLRFSARGRSTLFAEQPNARAALDYAAATEPAKGLEIAAHLSTWWFVTDRYHEGRATFGRALAASGEGTDPGLRARAHAGSGLLALFEFDAAGVAEHLTAGLAAAEASGDPVALAKVGTFACAALAGVTPLEAQRHGRRAVELLRPLGPSGDFGLALASLGSAYLAVDDYDSADEAAEEAAAVAREVGDALVTGWSWWIRSVRSLFECRLEEAIDFCTKGLDSLEVDPPTFSGLLRGYRLRAHALAGSGVDALAEGYQARVRIGARSRLGAAAMCWGLASAEASLDRLQEAVAVATDGSESSLPFWEGNNHDLLARVAIARGDAAAARRHADELERRGEVLIGERFAAQAAYARGRAALIEGDAAAARTKLQDALELHAALGQHAFTADTLEALGAAVLACGDAARGTRLAAAGAAERRRLGLVRVPPEHDWLAEVERHCRAELGESFDAEWEAGSAASLDAAVAYALRSRGARNRPADGWEALTPAEAQVADLAVQGLTNPEIAERLFMSRSTVKAHLSRAFAKLEVSNRTELAAAAARRER